MAVPPPSKDVFLPSFETFGRFSLRCPRGSTTTIETTPVALFIKVWAPGKHKEIHPPTKAMRYEWVSGELSEVPLPDDGSLISVAARSNALFFYYKAVGGNDFRTLRCVQEASSKELRIPTGTSTPFISPKSDFLIVPSTTCINICRISDGASIQTLDGSLLACHWTSARRFRITLPGKYIYGHVNEAGAVESVTIKTSRPVHLLQYDCVNLTLRGLTDLPIHPSARANSCLLPIDPELQSACVLTKTEGQTQCTLFKFEPGDRVSCTNLWSIGDIPIIAAYDNRVALHRLENGTWILFFHDCTKNLVRLIKLNPDSSTDEVEHAVPPDARYSSISTGSNTIVVHTSSDDPAEITTWTCCFDDEDGGK